MKNQYFGDIRDLFKYDLVEHTLHFCQFETFYFVPMLTANDDSTEGSKIDYSKAKAGYKNKKLKDYLKEKISSNIREVNQINSYFQNIKISYLIDNQPFEHRSRKVYFEKVKSNIRGNSLIYLDPDIGLETKLPNEKHILFSEVKALMDKCDDSSVIIVYQHFIRKNHITFIKNKIELFIKTLQVNPLYISDNEIIFFFLPKSQDKFNEIQACLKNYNSNYRQLYTDYCTLINPQQKLNFID